MKRKYVVRPSALGWNVVRHETGESVTTHKTRRQARLDAVESEIRDIADAHFTSMEARIKELEARLAVATGEPKTTDYCTKCGASPDAGEHQFDHD